MGAKQDRIDLPFPFLNTTTAPTDYWTFGSRLFVQDTFIFPKKILGTLLWYLEKEGALCIYHFFV